MLRRALPDSAVTLQVLSDELTSAQPGPRQATVLRLKWRNSLPNAIHTIHMEQGMVFGGELIRPHAVNIERLRVALEAADAREATKKQRTEPMSTSAPLELYVDDLVDAFAPTLKRTLEGFGAKSNSAAERTTRLTKTTRRNQTKMTESK